MTVPATPILLRPLLDLKPWGGRRLESCGIALGEQEVGEALLTAPDAIVATGPLAGLSLAELVRLAPEVWIGGRGLAVTGGREIFPLLVKLIDANATLSIQVHPGDAMAALAKLGTGKTEAWHLLEAAPGSVLYLGLRPEASSEAFIQACLQCDGSAAAYLRQLPASPGMTILVPAGTPHAIGAGCLIYEIQQPSNVTFRLDDWGRRDAFGQARALHHDDGFAALDPHSRPDPIAPLVLSTSPRRELLVATRYFALERIALSPLTRADLHAGDSPQVLTGLRGEPLLSSDGWQGSIRAGETYVVPAEVTISIASSGHATVLRGWVPDLDREIMEQAAKAGISRDAVEQLGVAVGLT